MAEERENGTIDASTDEIECALIDLVHEAREIVTTKATDKGYRSVDGIYSLLGTEHAIGEIIYKALRYRSRGDREDLVKIVGWAGVILANDFRDR